MDVFDFAGDDMGGIHVAHSGVFPSGYDDRDVFLHRSDDPRILRVDLVILIELARLDRAPHELVREVTLPGSVGRHPFLKHGFFQAPHRFHLRDAGVGHAVHVAVEQGLLVGRREVAVMRHALVVIVGDEVEDILFEIRSGAGNDANLVAADHFGEGEPEFPCAHGPGQRDEHFAAVVDELTVAIRGIDERGGVEVAVMVTDEVGDGFAHRIRF